MFAGWVIGTNANVFVTNHDTERVGIEFYDRLNAVYLMHCNIIQNGGALNANSPSNTYTLAHVFSLYAFLFCFYCFSLMTCDTSAHPYGRPSVLSSYSGFTNTDLGAPNNGALVTISQLE
jgi:hypothetical protein